MLICAIEILKIIIIIIIIINCNTNSYLLRPRSQGLCFPSPLSPAPVDGKKRDPGNKVAI